MFPQPFLFWILIFCSSIHYSCSSSPEEQALTKSSDSTAHNAVKESHNNSFDSGNEDLSPLGYKMKVYEAYSSYILSHENGEKDTTKYYFEYPEFEEEWVNKLIFSTFFEGNSPEEIAHDFIENFEDIYKKFEKEGEQPGISILRVPWEEIQKITVVHETAKYITLQLDFYNYSGGAHGIPVFTYLNIDKNSRKILHLEDLIQQDKIRDFITYSEKEFRKAEGLSSEASLEDGYFFDNGTFSISDNIGLTENGLSMVYNVYEIKSYAEGLTKLLLDYEEVKVFLTKKGREIIY